ncbi:nucleotidyltransferase family protein [Fulvivirga sp. 29W222]|uniref:Nucleotidyltransferase family protein n=1 Tax=Fulvivirga marina TaxID=2494733 RepID=A0A937G1V8_9BACT|nr:nucleotidyltransferase family protein [Fulvivirga marina]MBL6446951.1 nucleotidyltransferase family protein [Fulvivirga marina]
MSKIGVIILAAGSSSRLGRPKQLLRLNGESLLQKSIKAALDVSETTLTVLGAHYQEIGEEIKYLKTESLFNLDWNKGMGNSIKFGLHEIHKLHPDLNAVIIMVCDQPFVTGGLLNKMIEAYHKGHPLVASAYGNTVGVPALFDRQYFKQILKIDDKKGAKAILGHGDAFLVPFPLGGQDIDTPKDWENFKALS